MTEKGQSRSQMNMNGPLISMYASVKGFNRQDDRSSYMTAIAKRNAVTSSTNPMMEIANVM